MSDVPPSEPDLPLVETENKLTSEQFEEFKEALEVLYVIGNLSGRLKFAQSWPLPARYVLGEDLLRQDQEGAADKEQRMALEEQAEERRIALLEFMDGVERNSVLNGALQVDYVRGAIEKMGREISLLIYGQKIVDRFLPSLPEEQAEEIVEDVQDSGQEQVSKPSSESTEAMPEESSLLEQPPVDNASVSSALESGLEVAPGAPTDSLDMIRPIDMEESAPAAASIPSSVPSEQNAARRSAFPLVDGDESEGEGESLHVESQKEDSQKQAPQWEFPQQQSPQREEVLSQSLSHSLQQQEDSQPAPKKSVSGMVQFPASKNSKKEGQEPPESGA